jgi:hypothetical protein
MMNWIYTWHNPRIDADAERISSEMGNIFLRGVMNGNLVHRAEKTMRAVERKESAKPEDRSLEIKELKIKR